MPSSTETASTAKRGRPGYDQQSVLRIAVDVFNRHGYDATSMGILADNLGISKSAIYHHVPS
jgi:AcrR family transcriptional regulator